MDSFASIAGTVPEPCRVAGTWLKPFCLGHHILFRRLALPFADAPLDPADASQLLTGVAVCAGESYEQTLADMCAGRWEADVKRWLKRVRFDSESEALFRAYIADGYSRPPINRAAESKSSVGYSAPWELIVKCRLVLSGFSESEVLNGYLPARWYDFHTVNEFRQFEFRERAMLSPKVKSEPKWMPVFHTESEYRKIQASKAN